MLKRARIQPDYSQTYLLHRAASSLVPFTASSSAILLQLTPVGNMAQEDSTALETQMEFAVQMTCQNCVDDVKKSLLGHPGINDVFVSLEDEVVLVKSLVSSDDVQKMLESTGKLVVFRGYGGVSQQAGPDHNGAAVAIMKGEGGLVGLARLVQVTPTHCLIEGTVDGLIRSSEYSIKIHEFGDISQGCESCGGVFGSKTTQSSSAPAGDLGVVMSNDSGRAVFKMASNELKVWDLIGRSMIIHSTPNTDNGAAQRLMCGVIARSAGLFQNSKKICTCDGVTIWEEAEKNRHPALNSPSRL